MGNAWSSKRAFTSPLPVVCKLRKFCRFTVKFFPGGPGTLGLWQKVVSIALSTTLIGKPFVLFPFMLVDGYMDVANPFIGGYHFQHFETDSFGSKVLMVLRQDRRGGGVATSQSSTTFEGSLSFTGEMFPTYASPTLTKGAGSALG